MKKMTIVMYALMIIGLSSCSKDNEEDILIGDNGIKLEGVIHPDYVPEKEFRGFVNNYVFQFYFYSLSNQEIEADTRAVLPPMIFGDTGGKWLEYCPTSFFIKDNELYCSAQMDWDTYERWEEYAQKHKIALYVHSTFLYDETTGSLKTDGHIMPAEKDGMVYRMVRGGLNAYSNDYIGLYVELNKPLLSSWDGTTELNLMRIDYNRVSTNYPFDTELKVFETNEEAVAYAKELMAK